MTGCSEELIRDELPSYLDITKFIQLSGTHVDEDLYELWRRIVFNILISNTDDHLRNYGFILTGEGLRLYLAYDVNPPIDRSGLALNINMDNNSQDTGLAKSVRPFFDCRKRK